MNRCDSIQNSYNATLSALRNAQGAVLNDQIQIRAYDPTAVFTTDWVTQRIGQLEQQQPPNYPLIQLYQQWQTDTQNVSCIQGTLDYWVTQAQAAGCTLVTGGQ